MERSIKLAKLIFTPLALGFFIYFGWQSRSVLAAIFVNAEYYYLILAILAWMTSHFVISMATVLILKTVGATIPYQTVFKVHVERLPARYIPGGIWHSVGRILDFYSYGIKPVQLTAFFLLENIIAVCMAFILGGIFMLYFRGLTDIWGKIAGIAFICSVLGLFLIPTVMKWKAQLINKYYWQTIAVFIPHWFLITLAFILYLSAFASVFGVTSNLEIGGIFMFSWGIGFLAIFAPQGIGVFEVVAGNIFNVSITLGNIAVLLAGFRIIALIADSCLWICMRVICNHKISFR